MAVEWYKKAAGEGDREAMFSLGLSYELGQGVEQDYTQAAHWYEPSAQLGSAVSAFCIQGSGTYSGVRSLEETVAFLKDHPARIQPLA